MLSIRITLSAQASATTQRCGFVARAAWQAPGAHSANLNGSAPCRMLA